MTRRLITITLLFLVSASLADKEKPKELEWLSFAQAMKLSKSAEKPLYVYLFSTNCGWCKRFANQTLKDTTVINKLAETFVVTQLNTSSTKKQEYDGNKVSERQIARMFAVRGVPASAFVDDDGKIVAKLPGYIPQDKFLTVLEYIGGGWYKDMTYNEFIESEEKMEK